MNKNLVIFLILLFSALSVLASGGENSHHALTVPWSTIFAQIFNVSIIVFGLWYYLRKPIAQYFEERRQTFIQSAAKIEQAHEEAKRQHQEIAAKLESLKSSADQSIQKAHEDAKEYRQKAVKEANELAAKIRQDARKAVELEVQKAESHLREELVSLAIQKASEKIRNETDSQIHQNLESDFMEKVKVVQT